MFSSYIPLSTSPMVKIGDGKLIPAVGKGTITLCTLIDGKYKYCVLEEVWHVPDLAANLFSARTAARKGYYICIHNDVCTIHSGNQLITTAKDIDGMYCLDTKVVRDVSQNISTEFALQVDIQLWHKQLGHASPQQLAD